MDSLMLSFFIYGLISLVGLVYIIHGKHKASASFVISGLTMSFYMYFIDNLWINLGIALVLAVLPFFIEI